jgi:hypothetical protein
MPYNSQNNDALIKELKFALKSVREWQNSTKIYPCAGFAGQKAEVVEQLKIHSTLIGQRISTNNEYQQIFLHWECMGQYCNKLFESKQFKNVVGGKPVQIYLFKFKKFSQ